MEHLCTQPEHGYSWVSRWGEGGDCQINIDGVNYFLRSGDRDCASAIISAFEAAGISCGGAETTYNMRSCMTGTGNFRWHPMSSGFVAQRGDVYLNEQNHTAMCISAVPDRLAEFSYSETGDIDGVEGDQTGYESHFADYYDFPWDGILECINAENNGEWKWDSNVQAWWYRYADGNYPKSEWLNTDGKWYYFNAQGYALSSEWVFSDGYWYYLNPETNSLGKQGKMIMGRFVDEGYTYYCRTETQGIAPAGSMVMGWYWIDDGWYYFTVEEDGQPVGSMYKDRWVYENGHSYYLKSSGKMARNEKLTIDGYAYTFNDKGEAQRG